MVFIKILKFEKKFQSFLHLFFHAITAPQTLNGSQNIQGFDLIRAVLFLLS